MTDKQQHTPGPWVMDGCAITKDGRTIAMAWPNPKSDDGMIANAALIAAAPETAAERDRLKKQNDMLYLALQKIIYVIEDAGALRQDSQSPCEIAREALAKHEAMK